MQRFKARERLRIASGGVQGVLDMLRQDSGSSLLQIRVPCRVLFTTSGISKRAEVQTSLSMCRTALSKGSRVVNLGSDSLQAQCSFEDILGTKPARPRCTDPLDPSYKAGSALSGNASTKSDASTQPGGEWLPNRNSNQGSGFSVLFRGRRCLKATHML